VCATVADQVYPAKVIILEGILVLHIPELREQCSMRIYVDTGQHTYASTTLAAPLHAHVDAC
jgi:uridine kinase